MWDIRNIQSNYSSYPVKANILFLEYPISSKRLQKLEFSSYAYSIDEYNTTYLNL